MKLFHKHKWTKWKVIEKGEIFKTYRFINKTLKIGNYLIQQRECEDCGKIQLKEEESS